MNRPIVAVRMILNDEDVEGLIAIGAPSDEYQHEAEQIIQAIEQKQVALRETDIAILLENVWRRAFGPLSDDQMSARRGAFLRIAGRIARECAAERNSDS